ncbi:beta-propeller fold lactonase family protein [Bordetella sp. LUAb4]|uniref:lactonase family protein n=1 Tax=Bordetella sp. LUAb4 TaxID=2843195 RepID=UPI001E48C4DE
MTFSCSKSSTCRVPARRREATSRWPGHATAAIATGPGSGPRHLVFHPTLDRLYCVNEHAGSVAAYSVDRATVALREVKYESLMPADFSGPAMGADIHLTPDGAFLYASVRKTDAITTFRLDAATGLMALVGALEVEDYPRGFAINGNFKVWE